MSVDEKADRVVRVAQGNAAFDVRRFATQEPDRRLDPVRIQPSRPNIEIPVEGETRLLGERMPAEEDSDR
jgi:hypothetical protein